jgi:hypothetical protein
VAAVITSSSDSRHVVSSISGAILEREPFNHIYIQNVFPWDFFWQILKHLPPDEAYNDRSYADRMMCDVSQLGVPFWDELADWMLGEDFCRAVAWKLELTAPMMSPQIRLVRDKPGYQIKVHTDVKRKGITLLFYLPPNTSMAEYGTSIYVPKTPGFVSDGTRRFEFEAFTKAKTAPFLPNSVLGFRRCDNSFHGVEPMSIGLRNVLLYNINV